MKKSFWIGFWLILVFALLLRIIPAQNYNFFFTIDQGNDAVYAREFFERGQFLLKGPATGIEGVYAGPGWYYFISIGYKLFGGDPFGALFMVILLSMATSGVLMWQVGKKLSPGAGLLAGAALQFFWFFYDTSRWAFNPFPLVFLSAVLILLLVRFLEDKKAFPLALLPIFLAFNTEVAGAAALLVFYVVFGLWAVFRRLLKWKTYFFWAILIPGILGAAFGFQFFIRFIESRIFRAEVGSGLRVFAGTSFGEVGERFLEMVSYAAIPQNLLLSLVIVAMTLLLFFWQKKTDQFARRFVGLTLALFLVSFLFFGATRGWRDWHTVYLPPLLFVSLLLMLRGLKKEVGFAIFAVVLGAQVLLFGERYTQYLKPSQDPGILANQLQVLDWIYQRSEGDGFNAYVYTVHERDYAYQYLFWWYGRKTYGFVPCEYATYPGQLKYLYVPGAQYYQEPQLGCDKFRFLILEPGESGAWREKVSGDGKLVEKGMVGEVNVEKWTKLAF